VYFLVCSVADFSDGSSAFGCSSLSVRVGLWFGCCVMRLHVGIEVSFGCVVVSCWSVCALGMAVAVVWRALVVCVGDSVAL